jgi:hypothetical protein
VAVQPADETGAAGVVNVGGGTDEVGAVGDPPLHPDTPRAHTTTA